VDLTGTDGPGLRLGVTYLDMQLGGNTMAIKDALDALNKSGSSQLSASMEEKGLTSGKRAESDIFDPERPMVHSNINEA